jgi:signal peptidase I
MTRIAVRLAGLLAWLLAVAVAGLLLATFAPTIFGLQSMTVISGSMEPKMPVGSVAMTREVDARSISKGDIVSFRRRGSADTTTHRVISVKAEGSQIIFTTKGDANTTPDPEPVVVDGRIHKVEYVVPFAGYAMKYARTPYGLMVLLIVPIIGLAFDRRTHRRNPSKPTSSAEFGWSATTLSLLRLVPDQTRSGPAG